MKVTEHYIMMESIMKIVHLKHQYTVEHSERVAVIAVDIAEAMGCDRHTIEKINTAAILHDVGKIIIDNDILDKTGKLSDSEFAIIKQHAEAGYNILKDISDFEETALWVRYHHERYDGKGYLGKEAKDIPIEAFILQLADCIDAMATDRPYRKALSREEVMLEIKRNVGKQFHPDVVKVYFEMIEEISKECAFLKKEV